MGTVTSISWCDATWSPWRGCTPVSEGCDRCYARSGIRRWGANPDTVVRAAPGTFNLPLAKKRDRSWKIPDGSFVFVCSLSDFFHADADGWRDEALDTMECRPGVTFLLLTKRIDRTYEIALAGCAPVPNAWLGVTAENQKRADERIPKLLEIDWPGKKWVSVEPMLANIGITDYRPVTACERRCFHGHWNHYPKPCPRCGSPTYRMPGIDWIICGGESGPGARVMDIAWARSLRDQCQAAGVPFWMKQLGGWPNRREALEDLPEDLRIRERPETTREG